MSQLRTEIGSTEAYEMQNHLEGNSYPGRIAMMGLNSSGDLAIQAYAIMGRSTGSRTRIFVDEGLGSVRTVAPGKSPEEMAATENSALIYYQASMSGEGVYVISNGAQTPHVHQSVVGGWTLGAAVRSAPEVAGVDLSKYEPDKPNFTPRITGVIDLREEAPTPFGLAIVRRRKSGDPVYATYTTNNIENIPKGTGFAIQTYVGDGSPLRSFTREPYALPFDKTAAKTAMRIWSALNQDNRVALLARSINRETGNIEETCIINSPAP